MPRQCVLLCLKPIRKRLMRCQLLGQLEHVLGRPFSYVVLPRPDTLGVVDGTRRGWGSS
jgi:hypothetical protein